ncbi:MAG: thiol:disulfide interchange protein DsbA/DsbL [Pseudomonadota bacterium]
MKMPLIRFLTALYLMALGTMGTAHAAEPVAGVDYRVISPAQPTLPGKEIEVIEFFWYGCPHCYELQPAMNAWLKKLPKDVKFRNVPAIFRDSWTPNARAFYALEAMGEGSRLHDKIFDAIHVDKIDLNSDQSLFSWLAKQGVDEKKFRDTYASFAVQSKVERSKQMSRSYQLQGTPSVVVDGKYLTAPSMTGSYERFTQVLDQLIAKARQERSGKKN